MQRLLVVTFILVLCPALFGHVQWGAVRARPAPHVHGARQVVEAVAEGDQERVRRLAAAREPDPWLVAEELCLRGAFAAAAAYAQATPGKATERLPAYVGSRALTRPDAESRAVLAAMERAERQRAYRRMIEAATPPPTPADSITRVRILAATGRAFMRRRDPARGGRFYGEAAKAARAMGWLHGAATYLSDQSQAAYVQGNYEVALALSESTLAIGEEIEDPWRVANAHGNLGLVLTRVGRHGEALEHGRKAVAIAESPDLKSLLPGLLTNLGMAHMGLGAYDQAEEAYTRAMSLADMRQPTRAVGNLWDNLGLVQMQLGRFDEALASMQRALDVRSRRRDWSGVASSLLNQGALLGTYGEHEEALVRLEAALHAAEALNSRSTTARVLVSTGMVHAEMGSYAEALDLIQRGLVLFRDLREPTGTANALLNLGVVHRRLGGGDKAQAYYEEALAISESSGERWRLPRLLQNLGVIHLQSGDPDDARSYFQRSLALAREIGDRQGIADALTNLGEASRALEQVEESVAHLEAALQLREELRDAPSAAMTLAHLGRAQQDALALDAAERTFRRGLDLLETHPAPIVEATILWSWASNLYRQERFEEALLRARDAADRISHMSLGLDDRMATSASDVWSGVFEVGLLASAELARFEDAAWFLESGRATALRVALDARESLRAATIPGALRREEALSSHAEARALDALRRAVEKGMISRIRTARRELSEAQAARHDVVDRIQRVAQRGAAITYPRADGLGTIQSRLRPHDALVLYGLAGSSVVALVVRSESARLVDLGAGPGLLDAVAGVDCSSIRADPMPSIEDLGRRLVEPLALAPTVQHVIVSPAGRLGYLPFALLLEERTVSYVPSGTTYGLLHAEGGMRGDGVLALGDPTYGAVQESLRHRGASWVRLQRLPATRAEAEAVGDMHLLGADATEERLEAALTIRPRWRSVHFACHGLIDPVCPRLSALALTPDATHDGFLTCLEIFRKDISADLVVLSACETGKGRIYEAEGIVGLTRAFMFAGAPRVICSLWKVDDEATRVLMVKFYELWNPKDGSEGFGAAAALKKAQEYVRDHPDHPEWKHPYYWAAWVLWGLPD